MIPRAGMRTAVLLGAALAVSGCHMAAAGSAESSAEARYFDAGAGNDWPGAGRTYGEQHYSPLTGITASNLSGLGLAWSMDLPPGNTVTQPIAVDGVLYFVTGIGILHAVDAVSGKELWTYDAKVWEQDTDKMRMAWGTRGVAWWNGAVFFGTIDGRLIAVDARTGKQRWVAETTGKHDGRYITGAPRVFDGKIIIGHGGADTSSIRGYVTAYDAATGKQLWRFYTVPGNPADGFESDAMKMAASTWFGEYWKYGGGGTVWNAMSYDPETRTVFLGTGNGAPWNRKVRSAGKGDNLFLSSIVALDADTGKYKWHYQTNPGETWDYNAAMDMELADLTIAGQRRKVLMTAPKNGFFYVIDRTNGKLISATKFAKVTWATGVDLKTGRPMETANNHFDKGPFLLAPGPVGAHSWLPMSYSPESGLVYIPTIEMEMTVYDTFKTPADWHRPPFVGPNGGVGGDLDPAKPVASSALIAIDPVAGRVVWRVPTPSIVSGGTMATAGGIVFQGTVDNRFTAYEAKTGKVLWSYDTKAPTIAPPIAYSVKGRQYVSVLTGTAGSLVLIGKAFEQHPIGYREQARRMLTFAIGAKTLLPDATPYVLQPVADPDYVANAQVEQRGFIMYSQTCVMCHGRDVSAAGGNAPDLRTSGAILSADAFHEIVKGGALKQQGMPPFHDLDDATIEEIRQFVRQKAHAAAASTKTAAR